MSASSLARSHTGRHSTKSGTLSGLPVATEVQCNGFRPVISFDVNFIVKNYESGGEPRHWGKHSHAARLSAGGTD